MSIKDLFSKIKVWGGNSAFTFKHKAEKAFHADFFTAIVIIFVAFAGFGLGRLSSLEGKKTPILIERDSSLPPLGGLSAKSVVSLGTPTTKLKNFVAAKSGTRYYFPWCGGVSRIKEENKVWFVSEEEARKAGFVPAANCAGLK